MGCRSAAKIFLVPIRDLPKLDVGIGREDAEAQIHLWCVVGALIGVNAEFLPNSLREARELVETIEARQQHKAREDPQCADACEKGKGFAAALVEFHRSLAPGTSFDGYAIDVMRDLAGDQLCDWLGIPETGGDHSSRLTLPAPGRPIIANVVGALRGVCGDAICDALHIPTISISPTPPISIPLPDIGGSRRRARLKKAEIWGEALISRVTTAGSTKYRSRPRLNGTKSVPTGGRRPIGWSRNLASARGAAEARCRTVSAARTKRQAASHSESGPPPS